MNLHALAVWLFGLIFLLFLQAGRPFRVLGLTYVAVLVILMLLSGKFYYSLSDEEKPRCAIYAENYGQAGAIKYYGKKHGLPEPVCFNETFVLWAPDSANISTLIYVNHELGEDIVHFFEKIELAGQVDNVHFRENGLQVYLCQNPRSGFGDYYKERVGSLKSRYR
jgi:hypothetical protein